MFTPEQIDSAAAAIANARGARRGAPQISNIFDVLPDNLKAEVREDARAALEAVFPEDHDPKMTHPLEDLRIGGPSWNCTRCGQRNTNEFTFCSRCRSPQSLCVR